MTTTSIPKYVKAYDPWSAALFVDPIVIPIIPFLARLRIHPNWITILSLFSGLFSGILFLLGNWSWAGILFLLTFFLDAMDGKVARLRQITSEFGAKLDDIADDIRKPSCFLGIFIYFCINHQIIFAILTVIVFVVHVFIHKLYTFLDVNHCDLEFPEFHRKIVRKIFPRVVALYTFFEEQFVMFIVFPIIAGVIGLPKGEIWFFWGAIIATGLCLLKLLIILGHKRKGRYAQVHQDWNAAKGNLDKAIM
jgi:phosphatidylglycerophosphate synthase